jgi:hypothetical protein
MPFTLEEIQKAADEVKQTMLHSGQSEETKTAIIQTAGAIIRNLRETYPERKH